MRSNGIATAEISYSGSGDEGDIDSVAFVPKSPDIAVSVTIDGRSIPLRDAVHEFADNLIYDFHGSYGDNEGGSGLIVWRVKSDKIKWTHYDHYVASAKVGHAF
jgi:hypothetical protein